ncbi:MAG: esterase-like activity of phytase family protein [Rhodobacteraceae bacterium]|nr:esterase-like activity of phytase family protein [Paracoccaceae bacterium]
MSFETRPRIRLEGIDGQPPRELPRPPRQAGLHPNATYEALAFAPDGTLYTLPEGSPSYMTGFPVFQYTGGVWIQAFTLPPIDGFKPTGADFGPDGRLYILERAFSGLGFRTQVRRMLPNGTEQEVLIETPVACTAISKVSQFGAVLMALCASP